MKSHSADEMAQIMVDLNRWTLFILNKQDNSVTLFAHFRGTSKTNFFSPAWIRSLQNVLCRYALDNTPCLVNTYAFHDEIALPLTDERLFRKRFRRIPYSTTLLIRLSACCGDSHIPVPQDGCYGNGP